MREFENIQYDKKSGIKEEIWTRRKYLNCSFSDINLNEIRLVECIFYNCIFNKCSFKDAFMGSSSLSGNCGEYSGCHFLNCDLTSAIFQFPIIDQCLFKDCKLSETNFDGSIISNTKFVGELDSCFFRGHPKFSNTSIMSFFRGNSQSKRLNKMMSVDFSEARLVGVLFENEIDLSQCIFPQGDDYVYLKDLPTTMANVKEEVLQWTSIEEQGIGLRLIENLYFSKSKSKQKTDFIDRFIPMEMEGGNPNGPNVKLFNLMKKYA